MINTSENTPLIVTSAQYLPKSAKETQKLTLSEKVKVAWLSFSQSLKANVDIVNNAGRFLVRKFLFAKAKSIVPTQNVLKINAIRDVVLFNRDPTPSKETREQRDRLGLIAPDEGSPIKFDNSGLCLGGVTHFFQKSMESSPEIAAQEFRGGMPFEAAETQAVYGNSIVSPILRKLSELIIQTIESQSDSIVGSDFSDSYELRSLHEAITEFVRENHDSFDKFPEIIEKKLLERNITLSQFGDQTISKFLEQTETSAEIKSDSKISTASPHLHPIVYSSLRAVADYFEDKDRGAVDHKRFAFNFRGMDIEKIINWDDSPENILSNIKTLDPGYYNFSFPVFKPNGSRAFHATGVIIGEKGSSSFFFDPNFAIGEFDRKDVHKTVKRTLSLYNSLPTKNLTSFQKFKNIILRRKKRFGFKTEAPIGFTLVKIGKMTNFQSPSLRDPKTFR